MVGGPAGAHAAGMRRGAGAVIYWMTLVADWVCSRTPRRPRLWVSGGVGVLVYWLWPAKRHVTVANMAQVLGQPPNHPEVRAVARRSWRNYARYVSDLFALPGTTAEETLAHFEDTTPAPGWEGRFDRAHASGRGVLIATAHFGSWDAAAVLLASRAPLNVIAETFPDPRLNELMVRQRRALGMEIIPLERAPRQMLRILQAGGVVATPVDRPLPAGEGMAVTYFGRRCYVPGGFAQMAVRTGATILVGFTWHREGYDDMLYGFVSEPIVPEPSGDRGADAVALTQRIYDVIEEVVRARPALWYMFRPFWPAAEDATGKDATWSPAADQRTAAAADASPTAVAASAPQGAHVADARIADAEGRADG